MVEERRTELRGPTSTLEIENMISLYFQLCYEDIFCLLGNNDGGERNLHANFHDESKQESRRMRNRKKYFQNNKESGRDNRKAIVFKRLVLKRELFSKE